MEDIYYINRAEPECWVRKIPIAARFSRCTVADMGNLLSYEL